VKSSFTETAEASEPSDERRESAITASLPVAPRTAGFKDRLVKMSNWMLPVLFVVFVIVLWQILVVTLGLKPYFIPSPTKIAQTFQQNFRTILDNAVPTIAQAATGFAIGNAVAILLSVWFVHVRSARRSFYPLAIILQSIPLVALAPIAIVTLGNGFTSKVVMTALITFFPTLVNLMKGLEAVDPAMLQLFQSVNASRWAVLRKLRFPTALPYLFAALRITASASVIGAIIVEWIGSDTGLGYMIINSTYQFNTPLLWASILASSILVLGAFGLVVIAERLLVPWGRSGSTA
jgi:NitT/TauT family transport system permease protein